MGPVLCGEDESLFAGGSFAYRKRWDAALQRLWMLHASVRRAPLLQSFGEAALRTCS